MVRDAFRRCFALPIFIFHVRIQRGSIQFCLVKKTIRLLKSDKIGLSTKPANILMPETNKFFSSLINSLIEIKFTLNYETFPCN